jgi:hypothetical protein
MVNTFNHPLDDIAELISKVISILNGRSLTNVLIQPLDHGLRRKLILSATAQTETVPQIVFETVQLPLYSTFFTGFSSVS